VRRVAVGLVIVAVLGVAAYLALRPRAFSIAPAADRNILLVTIDTLRADAVGAYGGEAATPNLDRLAATGARFTFAHAHAVLTLPSHASLLTGRHPYEHGIRDNTGFRVRDGERTLAVALKAQGFSTGAFVSAFTLDQRYGLNAGFDIYDDRVSEVGTTTVVAVPERRADAAISSALGWIGAQQRKWFAWVHVFDPHAPYAAPPDWAARYPSNAYAGEVAWTDFALGSLFARLEQEARPTLVIVTADHGEGLGEHGELTHGIFAYETTIRVPLIIAEAVPGRPPTRGVIVDAPARHIDVMPTVFDAIGIHDGDLPGGSLAPAIAGDPGDRPAYFEAMMPTLARGWAPLRGVIAGREKLIDLPIPEFYDLGADPAELQNVVSVRGNRPDVLRQVLRGFDISPPGLPAEEAASARERLRALGYMSGSPATRRDVYTEEDDPKKLIELDRLLHRGSEQYLAGRPADAIATYREILKRRPDMADAYRAMAFALWQTGRTAEAIATLEAAIRNGVTQRDLQVRLGVYLAETGVTARAIPLLESLPQHDTEVLNALGLAYGQTNRDADAMRVFRRALEIDPTSGLAWQNIGTLQLRAGDLAEAEASLRRALEIDPTLSGANTTLGVVLIKTDRRAEAIDAWKRAVELEPTEFHALYNLTLELMNQGRDAEARAYGERYLATAPPSLYGPDLEQIRKLLGRR
jgi:arylsulfatase A-like enzyme/Tfp pilus assembly protein PilF